MFPNLTQILIDDHSGWEPVGFFLLFVLAFYFIFLLFTAACYVMQSMGLYTVAKRREIRHPWLAWLPLGNMWIWGSISDQYQYLVKGKIRNRRKALVGLMLGMLVLLTAFYISFFSVLAGMQNGVRLNLMIPGMVMIVSAIALAVVSVIAIVLQYMSLYDIFTSSEPNNGVLYLLLSIFISVTMPFLLFACRNKDLGMPPRKQIELSHE